MTARSLGHGGRLAMSARLRMSAIGIALLVLAAATTASAAQPQGRLGGPITEKGEINGARYRIDIPEGWNGGLVVWLHGYRPPETQYALPGDEGETATSGGGLITILGELCSATITPVHQRQLDLCAT